jgi:hypothetical protein
MEGRKEPLKQVQALKRSLSENTSQRSGRLVEESRDKGLCEINGAA